MILSRAPSSHRAVLLNLFAVMRFFSITVVDPQDIKVQEGVILSSDTIHEEQPGTRTSSEVLLTSRRQEIPIEGISNPVYS